MNKKIIRYLIISIIIGILFFSIPSVFACTGFTASDGNNILAGNNEDLSLLAEPQLRVYPPTSNSYGRVVFYCKWPYPFYNGSYSAFGGLNDQGLFFDIFSTPTLEPSNTDNKPTYNGDIFAYCIRRCATVDEVVDVFNSYYIPYMDDIQGFFADKTGNSVIIEGDEVIYKQGNYQVVTNFYQNHQDLGGYPCWRYNTASSMLENLTTFSVNDFRDICEAVHVEGIFFSGFMLDTIYSNICDLNQGVMHIYFFRDYERYIEIRLPEIFEQGNQVYDLPSLFIDNSFNNPNKPEKVSGETSGRNQREYEYSTIGTDEDGDLLFYNFDWGDGTDSGWIGYYEQGEICSTTHIWAEEGNYEIRVKTKDIYGLESEWSDPLFVSMPKNKKINLLNIDFNGILKLFPFIKFLI
jgi:choloylglycine hydrolase